MFSNIQHRWNHWNQRRWRRALCQLPLAPEALQEALAQWDRGDLPSLISFLRTNAQPTPSRQHNKLDRFARKLHAMWQRRFVRPLNRCRRIADNPSLALLLAHWELSSGHPERAAELLDQHTLRQPAADMAFLTLRAHVALQLAAPSAERTLQEWSDAVQQQSRTFAQQALIAAQHLAKGGDRSRAESLLRLSARLQPDNPTLESLQQELAMPATSPHGGQDLESLRTRALSTKIHKFAIATSDGAPSLAYPNEAADLFQAGAHVLSDATDAAHTMHLGALVNIQLVTQSATIDMLVLDGRRIIATGAPDADIDTWHETLRRWLASCTPSDKTTPFPTTRSNSHLAQLLSMRGVIAVGYSSPSQDHHVCLGNWPVPLSHVHAMSYDITTVADACCRRMHLGNFLRGQFFTPERLLHIQSTHIAQVLCLADRSIDAERLDARIQDMLCLYQPHRETCP